MKEETQLQLWKKIAKFIISTEDCCRDISLKESEKMTKQMYRRLRNTFKVIRLNKKDYDNNTKTINNA